MYDDDGGGEGGYDDKIDDKTEGEAGMGGKDMGWGGGLSNVDNQTCLKRGAIESASPDLPRRGGVMKNESGADMHVVSRDDEQIHMDKI